MIGSLLVASALLSPQEPASIPTDPGLTLRVFRIEGDLKRLPELVPDQTPNHDRVIEVLDLGQDDFGGLEASFYSEVSGFLTIESGGNYQFRLTSDDGSRLRIDRATVIDHDGTHGSTSKNGSFFLQPGPHALSVEHFDHGGARSLRLEWKRPGTEAFELVPNSVLTTERDLTRVTSPGFKRIKRNGRPGDLLPLNRVHPSWRLETIRPEGFEPKIGSMAFLPDGRLAFGTFSPLQRDDRSLPDIDSKDPDTIYALDTETLELKEIATDVYEPAGMNVIDGELYVAHRKEITKLTDEDSDGFFETHTTVGSGWEGWNYHQFTFCLLHRESEFGQGKLYTALSTTMAPPGWEGMKTNAGPNGPLRGSFLEIDLDTNDIRAIAGGARTPNGLGFGPGGELLYVDNQGAWLPASTLCEVVPGRFYGHYNWTNKVTKLAERYPDGGHPSVFSDRPRSAPVMWLPHGEVVNSPTEILPLTEGTYAGQILIGELTAGGIRRACLERVDGVLQGAVFRHCQGFESGINRMRFGPDGALYVGGIGAGGNWKWRNTQFGLQRLVPTEETPFEILAVRATKEGFRIELTGDFSDSDDWLERITGFEVASWTYTPTESYGGPKVDVRKHEVEVLQRFDPKFVDSALPGFEIGVDGFEAGRVYHIRLREPDELAEDKRLWSTEAWYTLNRRPWMTLGMDITRPQMSDTTGVPKTADAVALISSEFPMVMRHKNQQGRPSNRSQPELIESNDYVEVGFGSGDLVSATEFGDAWIHVEWFSPEGGSGQQAANSGVYIQGRYEVQVLGSPPGLHEPRDNEAGGVYGVAAPLVNATRGPGQWNSYDLWFTAPRFEDGEKVRNANLTAWMNGNLIHFNLQIPGPTGGAAPIGEEPGPDGIQIGPLRFQDHSSGAEGPVRYRNVWIRPLEAPNRIDSEWVDLLATAEFAPRGGKATFTYEDGVLTGTTAPNTPNTFWTSAETFADFEMIWEAKIDPELNSGVQIRSGVRGGFDNRDGNLVGYQVEFDPSDRAWTAGLYEEAGRGWLHDLSSAPYARRAFRQGEWNRFRVVCDGPVIRTWINGVPAAEVFDGRSPSGHIGFQVHGVGGRQDPLTVQWRNVRLRRLR
ncbi:MAG: family 16 glycoside hydrolase [Planctomycetota bacterium]